MVIFMKLYKKFQDISIKQKLYLCIILFIILPLILAGLYLNDQFERLAITKTCETSLQILKQTRLSIKKMIADTEDLSLRILANDKVQGFAKGNYDNTVEYTRLPIDISAWLDDVIGTKIFFDSICISKNKYEILYQKGNLIYKEDPSFLKRAISLKGLGFWTDSYVINYYSGSQRVISFYRRINDFNMLGRCIGIERISINEEAICSLYKDINPYRNGQIFLVNSQGKVISATEKEVIGTDLSHNDYIKKAIRTNEGFLFANIGHRKNVVLFYTIPETGWHLIETIPEKSIFPFRSTTTVVILIAITLCILFGVLFSWIQKIFLVNPISRLLKEMNKLKKGNFNINLETESKDEIGEMNRSFVRMTEQLHQMIEDVYISKIKQREAELIAMEAQINPHFFYNTLDSIHWLAVRNKDYDVSEQLESLSEIFKHVLNKGKEIVTVRDELDFLENYMFIQKAKYGERIQLNIDIDSTLMNSKTPKLILQPLVENAILHGIEQKVEGGTIEVKIERIDDLIRYTVSDNGQGTDADTINQMLQNGEQSHNVFALKNIDERIRLKYGKKYGLNFFSKEGKGTRVEVLIPFLGEEVDETLNRG